jgi:bifunctional non-homologous end joining protein LigD
MKHTAILDGEIVALDGEGKSRFEWLFRRRNQKGQLVYYVFDLIWLDGEDLMGQPLVRRKTLLKRLVKGMPNILYVDHIEEHGQEFYQLILAQGLEGMVAKDKNSPYVSGKETWHWLKIKNRSFQRKEPIEFKFKRAGARATQKESP